MKEHTEWIVPCGIGMGTIGGEWLAPSPGFSIDPDTVDYPICWPEF